MEEDIKYNEKYIDRNNSIIVPVDKTPYFKIHDNTFQLMNSTDYLRSKKTKFGRCDKVYMGKTIGNVKKDSLFATYNFEGEGEPVVSKLYTGLDFINTNYNFKKRHDTAWSIEGKEIKNTDNIFRY
jgi:hypothetical protein